MTIRIRMVDEDKNSFLAGVEKIRDGKHYWRATSMNAVGGKVGSRHMTEAGAEEAFVVRTVSTAKTQAADQGKSLEQACLDLGLTADGKVPAKAKPHEVTLKEAPHKRSIAETHMRYDVLLNGAVTDTLYFNMRGYQGYLPLPGGEKLDIGEKAISAYRKEIALIIDILPYLSLGLPLTR